MLSCIDTTYSHWGLLAFLYYWERGSSKSSVLYPLSLNYLWFYCAPCPLGHCYGLKCAHQSLYVKALALVH